MIKDSLSPIKQNMDGTLNSIIVMEELNELSIEVSKAMRGNLDTFGMLEEMADVYLGLYYLMEIYEISPKSFARAVNVKMERQIERNKQNKEIKKEREKLYKELQSEFKEE